MIKEINVKKNPAYAGHERVFYFEDKPTKLKGFIAWHNTKLGPATGGTRLYKYSSKREALKDVLNLSEAMTYKCAMSGVPFGGGKSVIIASEKMKNKNFLKAYAQIINSFEGKFTTGTDVGITDDDIDYMSKVSPHILRGEKGNTTTSQMAAYGVYLGIKTSIKLLMINKVNKNISITIKGVGKIGFELVKLLSKDGFKITIADKNKKMVQKINKLFPLIKVMDSKKIHKIKTDIYSPCAMGEEFNQKTIKELNCFIIAGGANNQLKKDSISKSLYNQGIWYIPDYVINSGGLIQIVDELDKSGYNRERINRRLLNISKVISLIIKKSKKTEKDTLSVAKDIVNLKIHGK